jgi:hypothetical protein
VAWINPVMAALHTTMVSVSVPMRWHCSGSGVILTIPPDFLHAASRPRAVACMAHPCLFFFGLKAPALQA